MRGAPPTNLTLGNYSQQIQWSKSGGCMERGLPLLEAEDNIKWQRPLWKRELQIILLIFLHIASISSAAEMA